MTSQSISTRPPRTGEAIRILDEAERQILTLPTGKLRVVDVAAALEMSHANVYRFFKNRDDLLDGLVDRWLKDGEARALAAIEMHSAFGDQLKHVLLSLHVQTRAKIASAPGVIDIYLRALNKRTEAVERHRTFLIGICADILARGINDGEFAIKTGQIAPALILIESATRKFTHPLLISESLSEDTPAEAERVLSFFVEALRSAPQLFSASERQVT
ncbi:MAG: hypothetical protein AAFN91_17220 [Pseudomonadota bacterium]